MSRPGRLRVWWLGARPPTLVASIVPVAVGAASVGRSAVSVPRTLLALVVGLSLQVGVNYANDYFDGVRGVDTAARAGPMRLVASGAATPRAVALAATVAVLIAAVAGLVLALVTSLWLLLVGAAAILALLLYSGGPMPYGARGLGEVMVFLFFGLVATAGTAYVQQRHLTAASWLAAVTVGLLACQLLMVNNLRDIPTDSAAGKRTLAVRIGAARSRQLLAATAAAAFLVPIIAAAVGAMPRLAAIVAVTAPLAIRPVRIAATSTGRALVPALIALSRLELAFGAVLCAALLAS